MSLGTAPRRTARGTWQTRSGRTLTAAGAAYWEHLYRQGHTDGSGHMRAPEGPRLEPAPAESAYKRPSVLTKVRADNGDAVAQRQLRIYALHKQAQREAAAQTRQLEQTAYDPYLRRLAQGAYKTVNPTVGAVVTALSPSNSVTGIYNDARSGNVGMAALEAALLVGSAGWLRTPSPSLLAALRAGRAASVIGGLHSREGRPGLIPSRWLYDWPW